jgi:hypothetical protein
VLILQLSQQAIKDEEYRGNKKGSIIYY